MCNKQTMTPSQLTKKDVEEIVERIVEKVVDNKFKQEFKDVVRKQDTKNFATKDDLKNFATKDDLKNFATKDDLNVTNKAVQELQNQMKEVMRVLEYLRAHAVQMEFLWKAYTDVDKLHEDRMRKTEKRLGKVEDKLGIAH